MASSNFLKTSGPLDKDNSIHQQTERINSHVQPIYRCLNTHEKNRFSFSEDTDISGFYTKKSQQHKWLVNTNFRYKSLGKTVTATYSISSLRVSTIA